MFQQAGSIHEDQYGFKNLNGRSCASFQLATIGGWMIAKDRKMSFVFIDLLKALDTVRLEQLLIKLQKLGVSSTVLKWLYNLC